ncbi:polymer-forming cytoskeletal protein [Egicoccus sp. AB-alg2]|uniref:polymer-forming cytoskeletal protein n=1 Tax=Egicoccus sp. AB-alg2 TaxID=3242693 RepID=UPI00359D174F
MSLDALVMLVLSLLLLTTGGDDPQSVQLLLAGQHETVGVDGAVIAVDAQVTVPADTEIGGPVHVIGGHTRIAGTVDGDVTQLGGRLTIEPGGRVTGTLQHVAGSLEIDANAAVGRRAAVPLTAADPDPAARLLPVLVATGLLALVGARQARRTPRTLDNVRAAIAGHPLVCVTVGVLVAVTAISLFVFMAFTLLLIPVSLLGLGAGLVALGYGVIALGFLVGRWLPGVGPVPATALGVVAVMAALQLAGAIPLVGDLAVGALLASGLGAVLLTYFGLAPFTPARFPDDS